MRNVLAWDKSASRRARGWAGEKAARNRGSTRLPSATFFILQSHVFGSNTQIILVLLYRNDLQAAWNRRGGRGRWWWRTGLCEGREIACT